MTWKGKGEAKSFSFQVIDELRVMQSEKGDGGSVLRVGVWSVDGRAGQPNLEKRDYWNSEEGMKTGKAKGLSRSDFEFILKNSFRIGKALGIADHFIREAIEEGLKQGETVQVTPMTEQPMQEAVADPWK